MSDSGALETALRRLESALDRLESAAGATGGDGEEALARVEAERDLIQLRHRRLMRETETALGELDRLIADAEAG